MIFTEKRHNIYFVHIPKNAGNSIRQVCKEQNIKVISHNIRKRNKRLLAAYRSKKKLHAFCVSRNPYDRVVSAYHYLLNDGRNKTKADNLERDIFVAPYSGFEDFIRNGLKEASQQQLHFLPQVFWVRNREGDPEVETALKMENLQEEFNAFCSQMGINSQNLQVVNTSSRKEEWDNYYSEETKKIVAEIYQEDFEYFGYHK